MKSVDYRPGYLKRLKNRRYAAKLLKHAFEESCRDGNWEAFGAILQDVISTHGSKRDFAKKVGLSRPHLYRMFGKGANPTLKTLLPILDSLGLKLTLLNEGSRERKAA